LVKVENNWCHLGMFLCIKSILAATTEIE
jgi:hypothetical protein